MKYTDETTIELVPVFLRYIVRKLGGDVWKVYESSDTCSVTWFPPDLVRFPARPVTKT